MTSNDFIEASRRGGQTYRIDDVTIRSQEGVWSGIGTLAADPKKFRIEVTLDPGQSEPPMPTGFIGRSAFWEIRGAIDGRLTFVTHGISAHRTWNLAPGRGVRLRIDTHVLDLAGLQRDCGGSVNAEAEEAVIATESAGTTFSDPSRHPEATNRLSREGISFKAVLPSFKLIFGDTGTVVTEENPFLGTTVRSLGDTCHGEVPNWKFALIQRDKDLEVHFRSIDGYKSVSEGRDESLFRAFLTGLAFTHGQHTWPISLQHRRAGRLVLDRVRLGTETSRSPHAPFHEHLVYAALIGNKPWKLQDCLVKAYAFFSVDSPLQQEIERLLYLLREASGKGVSHSITLLTVCTLFESLVHAIYKTRIEPSQAQDHDAFRVVRDRVCDELNHRTSEADGVQYKRLHARLVNAEPVNLRAKFDAVIANLGLNAPYWDKIYTVWKRSRNPASHRITCIGGSEETDRAGLMAESRIAGAINCLILRLIDYSGLARASAYEDALVKIPSPLVREASTSSQ